MKALFGFLVAGVLLGNSAFARSPLCAAPFTEISQCESDDFVAMFPFVSICTDGGNYQLMIDTGAGNATSGMDVAKSESPTELSFTATDPNMDNSTLTYSKNSNPVKSVFSYTFYGIVMRGSYTCNAIAQ